MDLKLKAILAYVIKLSQNKTKNYSAMLFDSGRLQKCDCGEMEVVDHILELHHIGLALLIASLSFFFFYSSQAGSAHLYSVLFLFLLLLLLIFVCFFISLGVFFFR